MLLKLFILTDSVIDLFFIFEKYNTMLRSAIITFIVFHYSIDYYVKINIKKIF